jgi:hypothetical protein
MKPGTLSMLMHDAAKAAGLAPECVAHGFERLRCAV